MHGYDLSADSTRYNIKINGISGHINYIPARYHMIRTKIDIITFTFFKLRFLERIHVYLNFKHMRNR